MRLASRSFIVNDTPSNIDLLDVGKGCPLSCDGCYQKDWPDELKMSETEEQSLIVKVMEDKPESSFFIYPKEITSSEYLLDSMKEAEQKIVLTNGYAMTPRFIDRMVESGIRVAKVTYFASEEEQMRWQNVPEGAYASLRRNMENAANAGIKVFANNVLWKDNIDSIGELAKQCDDMGVSRIKLIRERSAIWKPWYIIDDDMNRMVEKLEQAKEESSVRMQVSMTFGGPNFYGKTLEEARKQMPPQPGEWPKSPYLCPAIGENYLGVSLKEGKVFWCFFIADDPFGQIGTVDMEGKIEIDNPVDLRPETLAKKLRGICAADACDYQPVCLGGCRSTAYTVAKANGVPDPLYAPPDICLTKVYERIFGA